MTSTELITSKNAKKINFNTSFWANFIMRIKSLKKILIVMCVLHIIGLPLLMISGISNSISDNYSMYGFIPLSICCLCAALFCGFIIALNSFDYLYKKTNVDMIYSLPLTKRQHFLSDYFAGLSAYTVPYIISVIITFVIHGIANFGISNWASYTKDYDITSMMFKLSLCGLLVMIMFYTLTVLITSCCGSMFEAVTYNIIANLLIPGVIAIFFLLFFSDLYGINVDSYIFEYISRNSPLGACIGLYQTFNSDISYLIRWYIFTMVANVIYFFVAYFLYNNRKAEDVSKPFVFKAFYYIIMTAITFVIIAFMIEADDVDAIAPLLFLSAIVYFIFEVISNRGFRKFGWSILRYVATICGVVMFSLIIKGTNGFGVENKVPSISTIKSAEVNYQGLYQEDQYYYSSYPYSDNNVTFTDKDTIKLITSLHKDTIKNRFVSYIPDDYYSQYEYDDSQYTDYQDYYMDLNITYNTYLGVKISRTYKLSFEQYIMLKDLSLKQPYIEKSAESFKEYLLSNWNQTGNNSYYENQSIDIRDRKYYLNVTSKLQVNDKQYDNISYSQIMALYEAYKKDLQARTLEDIMTPDDTYCYINGYSIFSSYTNTINFLEQNNLIPPNVATELQSYSMYNDEYSSNIMLYSPNDIICVGGDYSTSLNAYKTTGGKFIYEINKNILELLKVAQPNYITTDDCYILKFNNNMFVIPAKYSDLAKEFYNSNGSSYYNYSESYNNLDYLSCYLNVHDQWKEYYSSQYNQYNDFITDLMLGYIDISNIPYEDYKVLNSYYDCYWNTYYNGDNQTLWNDWGMKEYPNYDDFVWYILKDSFNQEDVQNLLFKDDTTITTPIETTLPNEDTQKIEEKTIVSNMNNI